MEYRGEPVFVTNGSGGEVGSEVTGRGQKSDTEKEKRDLSRNENLGSESVFQGFIDMGDETGGE
jgi:hypothetical protein